MNHEVIALLMFSTMLLMLLTGQRVFGAIGFVASLAAFLLWDDSGSEPSSFTGTDPRMIRKIQWRIS